tara:strand:- start:959 stop:1774 length:816 start_codon:yes stop_codon:yes gene_type:complete
VKYLLTAVQALAVATIVAVLVTSAAVYFMVPKITEHIDSIERKAAAQYQKVSDNIQEIDDALSERIDYTIQKANDASNNLSSLKIILEEQSDLVAGHLGDVQGQVKTLSVDVSKKNAVMDSRSLELHNEVATLLEMIENLNVKVSSIQNIEGEIHFVEDVEPIEEPIKEPASEPLSDTVVACPNASDALNKQDLLSSLERTLQNTNASGRHDIRVWFDITEKGETDFKYVESGAASQSLVNAVQKYVGALVFEESDNTFANCEMVFKFNVT